MKIRDITPQIAMQWARCDEPDEDMGLMERVIMPAALAHMEQYTGIPAVNLSQKEDLAVAYLALCAFLYDNRSMDATSDKENRVIQSFLDRYQMNLI